MGLKIKTDYQTELAPLSKTYQQGDTGAEVTKIAEWLMLWQLNENYASALLPTATDQNFDADVEKMVKEVQSFLVLPATGVVVAPTWLAFTAPMRKAFDMQPINTIPSANVWCISPVSTCNFVRRNWKKTTWGRGLGPI